MTPPLGSHRAALTGSATGGVIADSLVARYTFEDDGDTSTLSDVAGANDGSITGMSYATDASVQGSHVGSFDGVDDYVQVGDAGGLDFDGSSFSVVGWLNPESISEVKIVLSKRNSPSGFLGWSLELTSDGAANWVINDGSDNALSTDPLSTGSWTLVTGIYDAPAGEQRIYLDDDLADSQAVSLTDASNSQPMELGRWQASNNRYYPGDLDDVRVYQTALTSSQVGIIASGAG